MRLINDKPYYAREVELPFSAIYDRRVLMEGLNCSECAEGCGSVIEWDSYDIDGVEPFQPQGFRCECGNWSCNECGIRELGICWSCVRKMFKEAWRVA